ncbi:MAG TPA: AbrB/MazE/SpoVT family DNA-binding domain-containing protein [Turneriella sp.]|nr:AbrB/MazE/SpoVT family DNA-binding domain-containing protein [Turneriella sp.]HNE21058.1 AbrB/MazE/SpoVT family DNA-binding domain-containing protein [Turneriella sp.]HNJ66991.1 AbrB/MazE/SpoVT family DNA-binding domain-containing protein [Turneriella sp.]HNL10995.1 AbrB/MazE/SpoVT family DNA-binding domain-containing protein [Turneriella sp.]HNL55375.1 AbrB/MazE/SpoVT family DNA-binding domain-containing protein [Turneriella sp.]
MPIVKVSPKFQVVIPKEIRENSGIKAGSKMDIFVYDGRIELVPIKSIKTLKGSLPGIDTHIQRDSDRI